MRRVLRFLSRISIRLMAFNLLLVFLPIAGVLYLGTFEKHLLTAQERSMADVATVLSASLSGGPLDEATAGTILRRLESLADGRPAPGRSIRLRVVDRNGRLLADSWRLDPESIPSEAESEIRQNWLYRVGSFLFRPVMRAFRSEEALEPAAEYERADNLRGGELESAVAGRYGFAKRRGARSVILYSAVPIRSGGEITGAALASQSTHAILQDLYAVRLGVLQIFVISLTLAVILSLLVGTTIVRPIRQLRIDAGAIVDRRGRLRGRFHGSGKLDEIGDLSRTLEALTRRLEEHVRFIETFASDVSHEFKNPLASIRMATEMIYEMEDPAERKRFLEMAEQDIARMEHLLSEVREITLIDARLAHEHAEPIELDQLLKEIIGGLDLRHGERARFELRSPDPAPIVLASRERLIQVFGNILDNAVGFSPPGGIVQIEIETSGELAIVRVSDEGPGISGANGDRIFDRFFTWRPNDTEGKGVHTGLGLAIARAIVEGYGGSIRAWNVPDRGACFEVKLRVS